MNCSRCGEVHNGGYDHIPYIKQHKVCFGCYFWEQYIHDKDQPEIARIDGQHYVIGDEPTTPNFMCGFGGRRFLIRFNDGRVVSTTNLWSQGEIPQRLRQILPDNAKFADPNVKWVSVGGMQFLDGDQS